MVSCWAFITNRKVKNDIDSLIWIKTCDRTKNSEGYKEISVKESRGKP